MPSKLLKTGYKAPVSFSYSTKAKYKPSNKADKAATIRHRWQMKLHKGLIRENRKV